MVPAPQQSINCRLEAFSHWFLCRLLFPDGDAKELFFADCPLPSHCIKFVEDMSVHYVSVTNCNGAALAITEKRIVIEFLKSGTAIAIQKRSLLNNNKRVPVSGCILPQRLPPHTELVDLQALPQSNTHYTSSTNYFVTTNVKNH
ncbi:hypothetical protein B0T24DRAFT_683204 [Lasiosphaeria ovina]|uniref:Uncharacterized protein n=1 Tax=Lasiosphaeria ovina TaxID=92902 RepID=A0AAE0N0Y7_9PEZI|nr:hypothetical protein B0T24DRAFT_683204 [Lasiosphaeria ovina]